MDKWALSHYAYSFCVLFLFHFIGVGLKSTNYIIFHGMMIAGKQKSQAPYHIFGFSTIDMFHINKMSLFCWVRRVIQIGFDFLRNLCVGSNCTNSLPNQIWRKVFWKHFYSAWMLWSHILFGLNLLACCVSLYIFYSTLWTT